MTLLIFSCCFAVDLKDATDSTVIGAVVEIFRRFVGETGGNSISCVGLCYIWF